MSDPIFNTPALKLACVLTFVIGASYWISLLWPGHPFGIGIIGVGMVLTACSFCLGMSLPLLWVPFVPLFWLLGLIMTVVNRSRRSRTKESSFISKKRQHDLQDPKHQSRGIVKKFNAILTPRDKRLICDHQNKGE